MATTKEYLEYVLEQMSLLDEILTKPMMGEYLLYYQGKHFGGVYDNRLLIKKTLSNARFGMPEAIPYEGAKMLYQVDIENRELIRDVVMATCKDLK